MRSIATSTIASRGRSRFHAVARCKPALEFWSGDRARMNSLAARGQYEPEMEAQKPTVTSTPAETSSSRS